MQFGNQRKLHSSGRGTEYYPPSSPQQRSLHIQTGQRKARSEGFHPQIEYICLHSSLVVTTFSAGLFPVKPSVIPESMYPALLVTSQATRGQTQRGKCYSLGHDFYVRLMEWFAGIWGSLGSFVHSGRQLEFWTLLNCQAQQKPQRPPMGQTRNMLIIFDAIMINKWGFIDEKESELWHY